MQTSTIREQSYAYFLNEAQDLLQAIEQDLLSLREHRTSAKVHNLMRSAHTLKGAAASVGAESIKTIAHALEDVFKSLYDPEVVVDSELEALLFEGYECLRLPITVAAGRNGNNSDDNPEVLNRAMAIIARLQAKLGVHFNPGATIPSSAELGFDITQSIFETGVDERLSQLASELANGDATAIAQTLQTQAEVFVGLAESLNLPGFGAIAQAVIDAIAAYPEQVIAIAQVALADFRQGQAAVLAGDRSSGGYPSTELLQLAGLMSASLTLPDSNSDIPQVSKHSNNGSSLKPAFFAEPQTSANLVLKGAEQRESIENPVSFRIQKLVRFWTQLVDFLNQPVFPKPKIDRSAKALPATNPHYPSNSLIGAEFEELVDNLAWAVDDITAESANVTQDDLIDVDSTLPGSELFPQSLEISDKAEMTDLWDTLDSQLQISKSDNSSTKALLDPVSSPQQWEQTVTHGKSQTISHRQPSVLSSPDSKNAAPVSTTLRINLEHLESISHTVRELLINQNRQAMQDEGLQKLLQELLDGLSQHQQTLTQLRDWSDQILNSSEAKNQRQRLHGSTSVSHSVLQQSAIAPTSPISQSLFDELELDSHNELHVRLQSALEGLLQLESTAETIDLAVKQSSQLLKKQGRFLTNIRDDLMEARMIPIGNVFNRFPHVLQQLTETYHKKVNLQLKGTHVLIDKAIAEKLYDPLLHLIRNAFDHGIEPAEVRCQQGKPEIGQIEICAYQQGNRTVIEVKDDGQGLNFQKICRHAFESQLLPSDQPEQFSKSELLSLLFEPGFSTAAQLSELSGRGVGLDVVRSQLRSLKGVVSVESELSQGTTFSLQLPLTLMTARLLICRVQHAVYAFLSDEIEKVLIPQWEQIESIAGRRVLHWKQGEEEYPVPIYLLSDLISYAALPETLAAQPSAPDASDGIAATLTTDTFPLLLLRWQKGFVGISVDAIVGEQELVIGPLGTTIAPPNYVYGCSILGNGCLTLVIDGVTLLKQGLESSLIARSHSPGQPAFLHSSTFKAAQPYSSSSIANQADRTAGSKQILVVDDSITVRQTLTLTLQQAGYQVLQAQDGLDAIAQLQKHRSIQLITCDLEMPRLNGYEFLMRYKQEPSLVQVPVVILTSRSHNKHQQLALQLGASDYLTKPYTEQALLSVIENLIHQ